MDCVAGEGGSGREQCGSQRANVAPKGPNGSYDGGGRDDMFFNQVYIAGSCGEKLISVYQPIG